MKTTSQARDRSREFACIDAVLAQLWPDGPFFKEGQLRRQGPCPQQHRQVR